jgi:hypothetical protein
MAKGRLLAQESHSLGMQLQREPGIDPVYMIFVLYTYIAVLTNVLEHSWKLRFYNTNI